MAHSAQAKKRIRQTIRRSNVNQARKSSIRTEMRKVQEAIEGGNQAAAQAAFRQMQPLLMASGTKGILHKKTISRTLSRFSKRIKVMAA